jgi:hypothetical protein
MRKSSVNVVDKKEPGISAGKSANLGLTPRFSRFRNCPVLFGFKERYKTKGPATI